MLEAAAVIALRTEAAAMEPVPAYLLAYFIRIRKHADEPGYLVARMEGEDVARVTDEIAMLGELRDLHFIGLSKEEDYVVFDKVTKKAARCTASWQAAIMGNAPVPHLFTVLARGRWYWTELVTRAAAWALTASVGAVIGAAVASLLP